MSSDITLILVSYCIPFSFVANGPLYRGIYYEDVNYKMCPHFLVISSKNLSDNTEPKTKTINDIIPLLIATHEKCIAFLKVFK